MGLEADTGFIQNFEPTWPTGGDFKNQGDNHLRMMKKILQRQFPGADTPFRIPKGFNIDSSVSLSALNANSRLYVNTGTGDENSAGVTITLPAFTAPDIGFVCQIVKTNTGLAPIRFVVSGGALINSRYSAVRRSIDSVPFLVTWNGAGWHVDRQIGAPILSMLPYMHGPSIKPQGLVEAKGAASFLTSAWVELATETGLYGGAGNAPDMRSATVVGWNNGMSGQGSLAEAASIAFGFGGAFDSPWTKAGRAMHQLTAAELASHLHANTITDNHRHSLPFPPGAVLMGGAPGGLGFVSGTTGQSSPPSQTSDTDFGSITVNNVNSGGDNFHNNMPTGVIGRWFVVAE